MFSLAQRYLWLRQVVCHVTPFLQLHASEKVADFIGLKWETSSYCEFYGVFGVTTRGYADAPCARLFCFRLLFVLQPRFTCLAIGVCLRQPAKSPISSALAERVFMNFKGHSM